MSIKTKVGIKKEKMIAQRRQGAKKEKERNKNNHEGHEDQEGEMKEFDSLSNKVIGLAIEVHRQLGPGLLESAYKQCLAHEFSQHGIKFQMEVELPVKYKGLKIACGYRIDLLVEDKLIVELKSVDKLNNIHKAQLLTYLKLRNSKIGLLINFNEAVLKNGIKRLVL